MTCKQPYAAIHEEVARIISASGADNAAELVFRAAGLHIRARRGRVCAAALAIALGNEMLREDPR